VEWITIDSVQIVSWFRRRLPAVPVGTYTQWSWPPERSGFQEMSWELEPRSDPSPVGYFWSHQFGLLGGDGGYLGLQTQGSEPTGKIAIFSIWGAIDAEGPQYVAPFRGEGTGMSVRIHYQWEPGRREWLGLRADGSGWWRAEVGDRPVGRIRVDPSWGALAPTSIMWTERYAPPLRSCGDIGLAEAWFGTPVADRTVSPRTHRNYLAEHRGCPGSSVTDADGGVVQIMGGPAERGSVPEAPSRIRLRGSGRLADGPGHAR
jgi:hypothetical protein